MKPDDSSLPNEMSKQPHLPGNSCSSPAGAGQQPNLASPAASRRLRGVALSTLALVLAFSIPLFDLVYFARTSEFHSYILLIPFISLYLFWLKRRGLSLGGRPSRLAAGIFLAVGLATVCLYWLVLRHRFKLVADDYLALMMSAFLLCFVGICCFFWSRATLRTVVFPVGMLVFVVPIPAFAMPPIDAFLQQGSALFAQMFFSLWGTPFLREGLAFKLPNITIQIAPECSGIQSSLVLVITGLLAAHLFLRTPWKRAFLILFVVVLGLIRNGFRVFVVGELCVHLGPQMINSYIHRKGGPIFFALSLIPLFLLLLWLQRSEKNRGKKDSQTPETKHAKV